MDLIVGKYGFHTHTHTQNPADAILYASKTVHVDVNAEKTKYLLMSPDENAG
jgi:hypothetical protein